MNSLTVKLLCLVLCTLFALFAVSCTAKPADTDTTVADTTDGNADNESDAPETTVLPDLSQFDFSGKVPSKCTVLSIGESKLYTSEVIGISNEAVAERGFGSVEILAKAAGVAKIAMSDGTVCLVCVLEAGTERDPSASDPMIKKLGATDMVAANASTDVTYTSSNTNVATVDGEGKVTFVGEGYAAVSAAGVSLSNTVSYVVYGE